MRARSSNAFPLLGPPADTRARHQEKKRGAHRNRTSEKEQHPRARRVFVIRWLALKVVASSARAQSLGRKQKRGSLGRQRYGGDQPRPSQRKRQQHRPAHGTGPSRSEDRCHGQWLTCGGKGGSSKERARACTQAPRTGKAPWIGTPRLRAWVSPAMSSLTRNRKEKCTGHSCEPSARAVPYRCGRSCLCARALFCLSFAGTGRSPRSSATHLPCLSVT